MITVIEPANIRTKELNFQLNDDKSSDIFVQSLNYTPLLFISKLNDPNTPPINGSTIDPKDVIYLKLHNSTFLPEIELYCEDSKGILFNDLYPFDHDTVVSIFVKSNSELTMPIRMDFRVTEYQTIKPEGEKAVYKYLIKGILDVDELYYTRYEARKGTSYDMLKSLALQLNLGFASNVTSSNDSMTWINPSETYMDFIGEATKYAYISDNSFVWSFIDFYYNLNYVDVQLEFNEFLKNESHDIVDPKIVKNGDPSAALLYLTNNSAFKETNQYILKFNLVNQSYKVNLDISYSMRATWYNKNKNSVTKQYLAELKTDDQSLESELVNLIDKNSQLYIENLNDEYFVGKIDSENNVHENYATAKLMNKYNLDTMEKMKMIVTLNQINFSIKRFQNIKVEIYNVNDLFSSDANTKTPLNNINKKLSGFWLVTGINYLYKRSGGVEQELTLMRRDLSLNYGQGNNEKRDLRSYTK